MVTLDVNGARHEVAAEPRRSLLEVLKEEIGLSGPKYGCAEGVCGVCTVLVDGTPPVEVILLDRPDLPSAGAGETPIVALAPAIANAVFAACGVRLRSLPLVPDGHIPA